MTRLVTRGLRADAVLNVSVRVLLGLFGLVSGGLALRYIAVHADQMVQSDRLLALCAPVLLFAALAGLAGFAAWTVRARGQHDMCRTLDVLSRIKREGEVAVSARGLTFAFEEELQNARRAFSLLLWLGRTLFLVCLGLFAAAVVNAMVNGVDPLTVAFGASSVAGSLLAITKGVPDNVKKHLADVIQVQTIVTSCDRQISLLESSARSAIKSAHCDPAETHRIVVEVQQLMSAVVDHAVETIERCAEPASNVSVTSAARRPRRTAAGRRARSTLRPTGSPDRPDARGSRS
jgi:hypothetical protein